ncbi:MAG: GntR family transcriptional regulator [Lachnospiraceae bacterium]|nr:GntR family transcriptional regulator [Lachnospiraceae bacterium]
MFHIDVMSRRPVYEQLVDEVEHYILRGVLLPDQQMQSVRSLSMELAVNPNTVQKAYSELDRRGIVYAVPGRGCFISGSARERIGERMRQGLGNFTEQVYELALAGIEKETVISCVEDAFLRKGESNDTGRGLDEKIQ